MVLGSAPVVLVQIIKIVLLSSVEILLLLVSKTRFAFYIPVSALLLTSVSFVLRCIQIRYFDVKTGVALAIILILTAVIHLFRAEKILLWEGDLFIFSISVHLITSLVAAPLAASYVVMDKLLYIDRYHDTDMSQAFEGFLTLPSFVWGLFFVIIFSLPVIYYSFSRKKA